MRCARIVAVLALSVLVAPPPVRAETGLAGCGKGLLLFSVDADASAAPRPYLKLIEADGWTVEARKVEPSYRREAEYAVALRDRIAAARNAGCRRIALAGESFGAWVSLMANASFETPVDSESVQVLIAVDASAARTGRMRDVAHDHKFVNLLKTQDATHLAVFLYDASAAEAEERRNEISGSLSNRIRDARVLAETASLEGPDGPHGEAFGRRYGPLLIELLDGAEPVGLQDLAPQSR